MNLEYRKILKVLISKKSMVNYKMVILVRKDLGMGVGKVASQCSHASTGAAMKSSKSMLEKWKQQGMKKIILRVNSEEELMNYKKEASKDKLNNVLIEDAGKTQIEAGTKTCLAIGPDEEKKIDKVTGHLKIL